MSHEMSRIEVEPISEGRTPPEGPVEERSLLTVLASDVNQIGTEAAGAAVLYGAKKIVDKIRHGGGPPDAGPADGQGSASPEAD